MSVIPVGPNSNTIFKFGKYKDLDISDADVPTSYLIWLEEQNWIKPQLRDDLNFEIKRRASDRPGQGKRILPFKSDKKS